ncbi:sensor histidine kinase [Crossiella cryophila]|uniref:histidine kinase n=1 Tax=Crossiella cryophila TaxID=43355 RepID=A0A7W7CDL5_9PSEU|nr:histidine kinase [Crossiella cryophila]MBB4679184.1 signal transduction histidine kinase [Crossiella cryophila]
MDTTARQPWLGISGWQQWILEIALYVLVGISVLVLPPWPMPPEIAIPAVTFTAVSLFLRRRFPASALVVGALGVGAVGIPLAYAAGRRIGPLHKLLAASLGHFAVAAAVSPLYGESVVSSMMSLGLNVIMTLWFVLLPAVLGRSSARRTLLVEALRERAVYLERERRSLVAEARIRERTRIAVDMHDSLGHHLTLISLQAGGLKLAASQDPAQAEAAGILHDTARRAMEELREIIGVLGQDSQDVPMHARRLDQLPELLESARTSGARVSQAQTGQPVPLPRPIENAIYRVAQEGLTNALRHAPGGAVTVRLNYESDAVIIEVVNTLATAPPRGGGSGQGLTGLRERVRLAGGVLHAAHTADGGFRVAAVLPFHGEPAAEPEEDLDAPPTTAPATHPLARTEVSTLMRTIRHRPVLIGVTIVGLVMFSMFSFIGSVIWMVIRNGEMLAAERFDEARIGETEQVVIERFGEASSGAELRISDQAGPPPEGMRCRYYYVDGSELPGNRTEAFRYCFRDGQLAQKDRLVVKRPF